MKNPSKTNFELDKIKLISGGGLEVQFTLTEIIGADTYKSSQVHKSTKHPHPDLTEPLKKLSPMVAHVYNFLVFRDVVLKKDFKADVSQKKFIETATDLIIDKINVTGFSLSGEEAKKGVVITSTIACDNNQRSAINTPRILLSGSSRGWEELLTELIDEITEEAYEFIYNNKVENPEMFPYEEAGEEDFKEVEKVETEA